MNQVFYVYNAFQPVQNAFQSVAFIFGDGGGNHQYAGLFAASLLLGVAIGAASALVHAVRSGHFNIVGPVFTAVVGLALFSAFIVPKAQLTVYDPVQQMASNPPVNLPLGVVLVAGAVNGLQRSVVELIAAAAPPDSSEDAAFSYDSGAGGYGYNFLVNTVEVTPPSPSLNTSLHAYIRDCVLFEMQRPGATITHASLMSGATSLIDLLGNANAAAVYTVSWLSIPADQEVTVSCKEAWDQLKYGLQNSGIMADAARDLCVTSGVPSSGGASGVDPILMCKTRMAQLFNALTGNSVTAETLMSYQAIARGFEDVMASASPEIAMAYKANAQVMQGAFGAGVAANQWIPVMMGLITAIAVGMLPILVLFIPTPIAGKALQGICGLFLFLGFWGICDAMIQIAATSYAKNIFESVAVFQQGLLTMLNFPTAAHKVYGMFGYLRSAGMVLSIFFTSMMVEFGGRTLAGLAQNMSGAVQGAGDKAGRLATAEGMADERLKLQHGAAGLGFLSDVPYASRVTGEQYGKEFDVMRNARIADVAGKGSVFAAAERMSTPAAGEAYGTMVRNEAVANTLGDGTSSFDGAAFRSGRVAFNVTQSKHLFGTGNLAGMTMSDGSDIVNNGVLTQFEAHGVENKEVLKSLVAEAMAGHPIEAKGMMKAIDEMGERYREIPVTFRRGEDGFYHPVYVGPVKSGALVKDSVEASSKPDMSPYGDQTETGDQIGSFFSFTNDDSTIAELQRSVTDAKKKVESAKHALDQEVVAALEDKNSYSFVNAKWVESARKTYQGKDAQAALDRFEKAAINWNVSHNRDQKDEEGYRREAFIAANGGINANGSTGEGTVYSPDGAGPRRQSFNTNKSTGIEGGVRRTGISDHNTAMQDATTFSKHGGASNGSDIAFMIKDGILAGERKEGGNGAKSGASGEHNTSASLRKVNAKKDEYAKAQENLRESNERLSEGRKQSQTVGYRWNELVASKLSEIYDGTISPLNPNGDTANSLLMKARKGGPDALDAIRRIEAVGNEVLKGFGHFQWAEGIQAKVKQQSGEIGQYVDGQIAQKREELPSDIKGVSDKNTRQVMDEQKNGEVYKSAVEAGPSSTLNPADVAALERGFKAITADLQHDFKGTFKENVGSFGIKWSGQQNAALENAVISALTGSVSMQNSFLKFLKASGYDVPAGYKPADAAPNTPAAPPKWANDAASYLEKHLSAEGKQKLLDLLQRFNSMTQKGPYQSDPLQ